MAARFRDGGSRPDRDGDELSRGRSDPVLFERSCVRPAEISGIDHDDSLVFHHRKFEGIEHDYDIHGGRIHHHDDCLERVWHDLRPILDVGGHSRTRTRAYGSDAADGQLDQLSVHNNRGWLEHRLGISVFPCAGSGTIVPGVRDPSRVLSHRDTRHQRDRTIGTIGHSAVQPGNADLGREGPSKLHVGSQGHRLIATPDAFLGSSAAPPPCPW